jgi:hypothetical protein
MHQLCTGNYYSCFFQDSLLEALLRRLRAEDFPSAAPQVRPNPASPAALPVLSLVRPSPLSVRPPSVGSAAARLPPHQLNRKLCQPPRVPGRRSSLGPAVLPPSAVRRLPVQAASHSEAGSTQQFQRRSPLSLPLPLCSAARRLASSLLISQS